MLRGSDARCRDCDWSTLRWETDEMDREIDRVLWSNSKLYELLREAAKVCPRHSLASDLIDAARPFRNALEKTLPSPEHHVYTAIFRHHIDVYRFLDVEEEMRD